jgi:nitroimidazol reductase NimA-like FMN-containing flavoprotein (pyridoxamine 5'-phosphate oxidase superfamily)
MDTSLYHNETDGGGSNGTFPVTGRTGHRRVKHRGSHERALVHAILDAGFLAHVGFATEHGPVVMPMLHARVGDHLYLHGSPASRLVRTLRDGVDICVTVTHVDALVLARTTFHHSVNYRSAVVFGRATELTDLDERAAALAALVDAIVPGRSAEARAANEKELRATSVLVLPIDEASAKVATGFRADEGADNDLPVWAGVLPLVTGAGAPVPDAATEAGGFAVPASVTAWAERWAPRS